MLKPSPYIGISGIAHAEEYKAIMDYARQLDIASTGRFVMVGAQATTRTQIHNQPEPGYGQDWYPIGDALAKVAVLDTSGLTKPFIHVLFENELDEFERGMEIIMARTKPFIRGIQLNGAHWMDLDYAPALTRFKQQYPETAIILQARSFIMEQASPNEVTAKLRTLPVDYVLFDASHGQGKAMNAHSLQQYIDAVYQGQLTLGVAAAGGLEASNIDTLLGPLLNMYPDLSFDAEGRLRNSRNSSTSRLSLDLVEKYLKSSKGILASLE